MTSFSFLEDELGDDAGELFGNEYTTGGTRTSSKLDIEIEGGETVRLDSVMVDKLKLS